MKSVRSRPLSSDPKGEMGLCGEIAEHEIRVSCVRGWDLDTKHVRLPTVVLTVTKPTLSLPRAQVADEPASHARRRRH